MTYSFNCPSCNGVGERLKISGQWVVCRTCKGHGELYPKAEEDQPMSPEDEPEEKDE